MSHAARLVFRLTPNDPHAFDGIPVQHRSGQLDRVCPRWFTRLDPSDDRE